MLRRAAQSAAQLAGRGLQRRCFADAVATQAMDWDALEEQLGTEEARREVGSLRSVWIETERRLEAMGKKGEPIKWEAYEGKVEPELLNEFRKTYSSLSFPAYDANAEAKKAEEQFQPLIQQAAEVASFSSQRLKEIEAELKDVERAKEKLSTATLDEELAADPKTAAEIDREIQEGNFMP